jgi:2-amino-4-hydroxy-6-hydroxymethyldihydropteridine diphosphokinase
VKAYFSLGSNLGNRAAHFATAIPLLAHDEPFRLSQVYDTEPQGGVEQDSFWNLVMEIETTATPRELLTRAHSRRVTAPGKFAGGHGRSTSMFCSSAIW